MKTMRFILFGLVAVMLSSCYSHRQIGYLQEPTKFNKLPVYDSVPYEPYRIRVNDEIIYRLITLDETMSKMLGANTITNGQYAFPQAGENTRSDGAGGARHLKGSIPRDHPGCGCQGVVVQQVFLRSG